MLFFFRLLCKFNIPNIRMLGRLATYTVRHINYFGRYSRFWSSYCSGFMRRLTLFFISLNFYFYLLYFSDKIYMPLYCDYSAVVRSLFCLFICTECTYFLYFIGSLFSYMAVLSGVLKYGNVVGLPARSSLMTVLRSPHVDKKARDQYTLSESRCRTSFSKMPSQLYYMFACQYISGIGLRVRCTSHLYWY